jgi:hypothetical protein
MRLHIRRIGSQFMISAKPPHSDIEWSSDTPMNKSAAINKMHEIGCHPTDIQDVITEAEQYGEGYLP